MTQGTTRRTVLATGAAALAAGCSDSTSGGDSAASPQAASSAPHTASTAPTTAAAASPSHSAAGAELTRTDDIPVGGGKIFKEQRVIVTQPEKGQFKAFSAVCTHQGCTVASVENGTIACPCHGSMFHAADGSVAHGPASRPLAAKDIQVEGNSIRLV
ncbi:iron-sulfur protein [Streptomyces sp. Tu 6176]|uniref:Rieske (2Fe-2S) protein n=1 Tax=Streptomyces sp. Tu 6176 TaxID=1470557 RepID=UPI00044B0B35|nr:Rieske (2Fe-2S) protein [Streptomyces sp. Tu 6176]EYT78311.1 iron-sulfur protein [Streptomyces sp. Tu 6176]